MKIGAIRKKNSIIKIVNDYLYDSLLPLNINYYYAFGSIAGICLTIQLITGIFLAMHYVPNIEMAFDSVEYIMREVPYGWIIRTTHSNGAFFFFFVIYLHMARGIYYGSYIGERYKTWITGVIIFLIMIITAFIGYSLVYGQMSLWGMTVITNLLTSIPFIGIDLVQFIWGGFSVGNATLNRFYSLHYLLPFILVGLVFIHLIFLHSIGSSNPLGFSSNKAYINFHPYYSLKDLYGFLIFFCFLFYIVFFSPYSLGHTDNFIPGNPLVTPNLIVPESYLLPFYAILRSIPNKTLGVIAMLFSILSLLFLPFLHFHLINSSLVRPFYKTLVYSIFLNFLLLAWIGQKVVESPFILLGQFFTFYYFFSILFLLPLLSLFELFLFYFSSSFKFHKF